MDSRRHTVIRESILQAYPALTRELVEEALAYGNAAAAVVVSRVSCSDAMPTLDELAAHLPPRFRPAQLARAVDTRRGN